MGGFASCGKFKIESEITSRGGEPVQFQTIDIHQIGPDGKIAQSWHVEDWLTFLLARRYQPRRLALLTWLAVCQVAAIIFNSLHKARLF